MGEIKRAQETKGKEENRKRKNETGGKKKKEESKNSISRGPKKGWVKVLSTKLERTKEESTTSKGGEDGKGRREGRLDAHAIQCNAMQCSAKS